MLGTGRALSVPVEGENHARVSALDVHTRVTGMAWARQGQAGQKGERESEEIGGRETRGRESIDGGAGT